MALITIDSYPLEDVSIGDIVEIAGVKLEVRPSYLRDLALSNTVDPNSKRPSIFEVLSIEDKTKFCSDVYGYKSGDGDFPDYNPYDIDGAMNLINKLFGKSAELGIDKPRRIVKVSRTKTHTIFTIKRTRITVAGHPIYKLKTKDNGSIQIQEEPASST